MKSFFVLPLLVLLTVASTTAFAPLAARPSSFATTSSSSSRVFLHPVRDAKDLEAVAYLQYSQQFVKEAAGNSDNSELSNNNNNDDTTYYNNRQQRVVVAHVPRSSDNDAAVAAAAAGGSCGPVSWCRRVLYNWTHHHHHDDNTKDTTTSTTLRP